jgi:bifunctional UDP-N-acetylglucosamine pyrophosphorylase / glucosamine-1-phosphate N-acetyltransferase
MMSDQKTRIAILAAGHGKRMKSETPKVLQLLKGKPIIQHLLEAVLESGVDPRPIVIVGPKNQAAIKEALGDRYDYVLQAEQRGTGDAVKSLRPTLEDKCDRLIVLNGDHPLVKPSTIDKLCKTHKKGECAITMMTVSVSDFEDWRNPLHDYGRVIRDVGGKIKAVIERKDATSEELDIKEVNPNLFCFNTVWLWKSLEKLKNNNAQGEYYITDLVRIAIDGGNCITSVDVSPLESIGVNTSEHLELASTLVT